MGQEMNREIFFRGKDKKTGQWLEGGYFPHYARELNPIGNDSYKPGEIVHLICQSGFADWNMPRPIQMYIVIPETVGEYTGLLDKNGVKIFEGDIVKIYYRNSEDELAKVVFRDARFVGEDIYGCDTTIVTHKGEIEVIGNIHDNPELLHAN